MMLTLQGCTSSHTLSPLTAVYTTCTRHPSSGSPARVSATAYLNTQVSSPGLSPIRVPSMRRSGRSFAHSPKRCVQGPRHQTGARLARPRAYRNTAHPDGQRCVRPPAYYKHQKLLATPGQRTRVVKKSSGVIFQGPMCGSNCIMDHKHRTQFLRTASMKQPTMYSYMASHRFLYQIVFTLHSCHRHNLSLQFIIPMSHT